MKRITIILCAAYVLLVLVLIGLYFSGLLITYLQVDKPDKSADVLICEGWISDYYYNAVLDIFQKGDYKYLLVTGNKSIQRSVILYNSGEIIIPDIHRYAVPGINKIWLNFLSEKYEDEYAFVEVFKNDSLLERKYIEWYSNIMAWRECAEGDTIKVKFTNGSRYTLPPNRVLELRYCKINENQIPLFNGTISVVYPGTIQKVTSSSGEEKLAAYMKAAGIVPVQTISSSRLGLSKTFNAANDAVSWMKEQGFSSANVISLGIHSRRTYASYKKADSDFPIGVICLDDYGTYRSKRIIFKELLGILTVSLVPRIILNKRPEFNK